MDQIHTMFIAGQVKVLLIGHCQGILDRPAMEGYSENQKTHLFSCLEVISAQSRGILIRLSQRGPTRVLARLALSPIIDRAKRLGCYQPHPRKKAHDSEVVMTGIGALIQHDASHRKWSPYAGDRWVLITLWTILAGRFCR